MYGCTRYSSKLELMTQFGYEDDYDECESCSNFSYSGGTMCCSLLEDMEYDDNDEDDRKRKDFFNDED